MPNRLWSLILGGSLLFAFSTTGRAQAQEEDEGLQTLAAGYYAEKHHLALDEARERLSIQDRAAGLEDDLEALLGDQFAGIWYDPSDKGRIKIGMTDLGFRQADAVDRLARSRGVDAVADQVPVRFTERELIATQGRARGAILDLMRRGHARTSYNTALNGVIVTALAVLPPAEEERLRAAFAMSGVTVRRTDAASLIGEPMSCNITYCDAPLRGGRQLRRNMGGGCTAAFMAHSRSNPARLLAMTAGHCDALLGPGSTWSARDESNQWHDLGNAYSTLFAGSSGLDAGTIRITSDSFWASPPPLAAVVVKNGPDTTYDPNYAIRSDSRSSMGQVLCRTGQITGTHCAEVSGLGSDLLVHDANGNDYQLLNMGELDMCDAKPGDSGGPLYKFHRAYGVFSSVLSVGAFSCYEVYQGVRGAEQALDVDILLAP
jgi:hypothetical protein